MDQRISGVIKSQAVRLGGTCQLGPAEAPRAAPAQASPGAARIIRQDAGLAVIEVVCACGSRIELHCRYQEGL